MVSEFLHYLPTKIGDLEIKYSQQSLISLAVCENAATKTLISEPNTAANKKMHDMIQLQLINYFSSAVSFQSIPMAANGTIFEKTVWHELSQIPLGETRTYGDIAKKLHSSAQAIGNACRKNPIQIIIPCHRVISAKGIGGYAGETEGKQINIKRWLLAHEGVVL